MKPRKLLIMLLLFLIGYLIVSATEAYCFSNPNDFWRFFRKAVLANNLQQVASLTRFPFEVRGTDDSDPVKHYDQKMFKKIFIKLITQPVYLPSNGTLAGKSMLKLIEEKKNLVQADFLTANFFRIEDLEFTRIEGQWLFTRGYLDE